MCDRIVIGVIGLSNDRIGKRLLIAADIERVDLSAQAWPDNSVVSVNVALLMAKPLRRSVAPTLSPLLINWSHSSSEGSVCKK